VTLGMIIHIQLSTVGYDGYEYRVDFLPVVNICLRLKLRRIWEGYFFHLQVT
jgi:hypothetical protein